MADSSLPVRAARRALRWVRRSPIRSAPRVIATFPGAESVDVTGVGRAGRRAPKVVVVATEPVQAALAGWVRSLASGPQPLSAAHGTDVVRVLEQHRGRRTALLVVAPPTPLSPAGVRVLERISTLLAEDPARLGAEERSAVLIEVHEQLARRQPTTGEAVEPLAVAPQLAERLRARHAELESYLAAHAVPVQGDRTLLQPRLSAAPSDGPSAGPSDGAADTAVMLEETAATVAGLLDDLRAETRRRTGAAAHPDAVVTHG